MSGATDRVAVVAAQAPARTRPYDDLKASLVDGKWKFVRKDGTPY